MPFGKNYLKEALKNVFVAGKRIELCKKKSFLCVSTFAVKLVKMIFEMFTSAAEQKPNIAH